MKKIYLLLFSLMLLSNLIAQEEEYVGTISKFGAAGGVIGNYIFPNLTELNNKVKLLGLDEFSNSGLITYGGSGYAYIMFWNNVRMGGLGYGGSSKVEKIIDGYRTQVDYSLGMGGFTVEYTLPFIKDVAVSLGFILGGGSATIEIYKNKADFVWDDVFNGVKNGDTGSEYKKVYKNFFSITPTLNLDIPLNRFIAFRLGMGYQTDLSGDWKIDNEQTLYNVPSKLNNNSFFISTGLFFGFFAF